MRPKLLAQAVLSITLLSRLAYADLATIAVDMTKKTVDPVNPTINIAASDSILLSIIADGKPLDTSVVSVKTFIAGPKPLVKLSNNVFTYSDEIPAAIGASPLLVFERCDRDAILKYRVAVSPANPDAGVTEPRCPVYTLDSSGRLWSIVIDQGIILVRVVITTSQLNGPPREDEFAFAIQVVDRQYALTYSAGFGFVGVRDDEYRLDAIANDATHLKLVRNGSGGVPYQLSAFTHYTKLSRNKQSTRSLSASFGLATKVPVNELTAMLGGTFSLRTLPLVNAGHLTTGIAYAPRKVLISDYRGLSTVPTGTSPASLTASKYGFGVFVAITFSFLGGEEQFKGVYSGKGSTQDVNK